MRHQPPGPLAFAIPFDQIPAENHPIATEVSRLWENTVHSASNQFEMAKIWRQMHWWITGLGVSVGAASAVSGLAAAVGVSTVSVGAAIAAALAAVSGLFGGERRSGAAADAGNALIAIRDELRQLGAIDLIKLDYNVARSVLSDISGRYHEVCKVAETPSWLARRMTTRGLGQGSATNSADANFDGD